MRLDLMPRHEHDRSHRGDDDDRGDDDGSCPRERAMSDQDRLDTHLRLECRERDPRLDRELPREAE